ncbi:MAG: 3-dehydroquinate synthase [Desulfobacterales bacterium]|nr:MAG: 3-dehydroquinate synthase [Desulfobacterales bacterium]
MKTYTVEGCQGQSHIHVGESLDRVMNYIPDGAAPVIVTDENLQRLYGHRFPKGPVITIGIGEKNKTLATVTDILKKLVALGCDRSSFILGIGGGIVCDITGFAASIFLRGVKFGFVSTSLLSQVDASVGGKNGVNLDAFKNMVGVFNQPEFVICDIEMLHTLPKAEISNGLAEIVKHGLIKDIHLFEFIEANQKKALSLDRNVTLRMVADSVKIKSKVVQADEREAGERRKLNFGHTIGHAFEKLDPRGHGRAVSAGMVSAALFSQHKGFIQAADVDRIKSLLSGLNLPIQMSFSAQDIINAASRDKKKHGNHLFFIFLQSLGQARVKKISFDEMNDFIKDKIAVNV